ncbi:MAG TPA: hypothetical protein VFT96_06985 [Gemmatimonadaceae bacterium]|nr:hypothetical protein [Gemmatimonadaceae bacterium]
MAPRPTFRRNARRANTRRTFFGATRAAWMSARARNALHRPVFIAAVSIGAFATALVALIAVPQEAEREARLEAAGLNTSIDTMPYVEALQAAMRNVAVADSALGAARVAAAQVRAVVPDSVAMASDAQREALAGRVVALGALIDRAENAPLPISYRALAESPEIRGDGRVAALLDTLTEVERERDAFGAVGGVDPIFVALTSRVNDLGRGIQAVAEERLANMRGELAALVPAAPVSRVAVVQVDTAPAVAQRQEAQVVFNTAQTALQRARTSAMELERRRRAIEADTGGGASPLALLAAALVIGAALGFASAFADELRRPRLADPSEAERVTGLRVLGVVHAQRTNTDRMRRAVDRALPQYVDPYNDGYQLAYLHIATASQGMLSVTVTGDEPTIASVVAVNLAAVSAEEARGTIVLDTDAASCDVAATLNIHAEPGVVDLIDEAAGWAQATQTVRIGRNSTIDVIASGTATPLPDSDELAALLRESAPRLERNYDTIVVVASAEHVMAGLPTALPIPLVICCVRLGHTRMSALRDFLASVREAGGQPAGLVVWDDAHPSLPTPEELASRTRRPQRTSEHRVPAGAA